MKTRKIKIFFPHHLHTRIIHISHHSTKWHSSWLPSERTAEYSGFECAGHWSPPSRITVITGTHANINPLLQLVAYTLWETEWYVSKNNHYTNRRLIITAINGRKMQQDRTSVSHTRTYVTIHLSRIVMMSQAITDCGVMQERVVVHAAKWWSTEQENHTQFLALPLINELIT
jgi:hypothetical protein